MKIAKRILSVLLLVCVLVIITLAGVFVTGYINGEENCPPPPCIENTKEVNTHS